MELPDKLKKLLAAYPQIQLAILFGSLSQGRERASSDLDIGVAGNQPLTAEERLEMIEALAKVFARPVDLVDLQSAAGPILAQILTKGRLIYCTDHALYAEIMKRMLFDEADMAPYRRHILTERRKAWIGN